MRSREIFMLRTVIGWVIYVGRHCRRAITLYKYNILERVLVENIIPRNVIINRGAAEVDNHISRDDFFD